MRKLASRIVNKALRILGIELPIRFGSLRRVTPVSRSFGLDRGWPVDRYYVEAFLERNRHVIYGSVLEAGGLVNYTKQFGGERVTRADVLYPKQGFKDATIIGDLVTGTGIPRDAFDCIIFTQVYQFVYDVNASILNTYKALKPNGVLLASVSGISQVCRYDMDQWGDYWRFTDSALRRLFGEVFGSENVQVEPHGNVLVACSLLHGLAIRDLKRRELEFNDPDYQVSIMIRAVKAAKSK